MIATTPGPTGHTRYLLTPTQYELASRTLAAWWGLGDSVLSPSGAAVVAVEAARLMAVKGDRRNPDSHIVCYPERRHSNLPYNGLNVEG